MKIYVGNIPYHVNDAQLGTLFAPFGTVTSARVVADRDTGQSKGFGFVEMADGDAKRAIAALNATKQEGRTIHVNEARVGPGA